MKAVRIFLKRHWKLCIVLAILLYLIIGMLAPFAVQKKIGRKRILFIRKIFMRPEMKNVWIERMLWRKMQRRWI